MDFNLLILFTQMLSNYKLYFYSPIRPSCGGVINDNLIGPVGVSS